MTNENSMDAVVGVAKANYDIGYAAGVAAERERIVHVMEREATEWDAYILDSLDTKEKEHGAYMAAMARRFAKNFKEYAGFAG